MEGSMSNKLNVCEVCNYQNINKPSVVWCSECNEGLCDECKAHHTASKGTRYHSVVPVSEYQKLPSSILEITQTCPKHSEKCQIFCKKHDCPCCRRCVIETHNGCQEMEIIEDVIQNVKSSNAFLDIENNLEELSGNLQKIRMDRQENIKILNENRAKIENEVHQTRMSINYHLDKLQESLTKELYAVEKNESTKIENIISYIQENGRKMSESKTNLDKIKQHASDLQTFLALKHIQREVMIREQFLESLIKGEKINHVSMTWKIEKSVDILPTSIKKMGTIILDTRPEDVTLTNRKNQQAQMMMPTTPVPTIDNIKLTSKQPVKTKGSDITGSWLLHDDRMIFSCDTTCQIYVLKSDGTLEFTLQPGYRTSHIHFIEESQTIVVTIGRNSSYIKIIDMKKRIIYVRSENYGIAYRDGTLFYNGYGRGLCAINLKDNSVTQLVNVPLSRYSSIAIWSDNLYFINADNSVICSDLQGGIKWQVELPALLTNPRRIASDNYGCVYVSGRDSNNVVVISPDGNKHRLLLSEKDGLKNPQSLFFDRKRNKLLVANQRDDAFLYEVSK